MINKEEAIAFLKRNQPLPDDGEQLKGIIQTYNNVRLFFMDHPDPVCVPLFFNSFGNGSGFGVYQLIEDVIIKHDASIIVPHLKLALYSPYPSVRYWCAQIAQRAKSEELIDGLINVFEKGDGDAKCASLTALSGMRDKRLIELANRVIATEDDEVLKEIAGGILIILD